MARTLAISIAPDQNLLQRLLYYDRDGRRVKSVITTNLGSTPTVSPTPTAPPVPVFSNAQFTYDGDGRRVKSVITTNLGSTTTYFIGAHYEVTGSSITKYYFAGSQRIAMRTDSTLYYLLSDHLGSTSIVTDASGQVVSQTKYKAWGQIRHQSGPSMTEYTYTGQYSYTGSFGLMFYNARWYDPALGRFAQADSIIPPGVQGLDRYAYVNNSPMNSVDPSGHDPWWCEGDDSCMFNWMEDNTSTGGDGYFAEYEVSVDEKMNTQERRDIFEAVVLVGDAFAEERGLGESSREAFTAVYDPLTFKTGRKEGGCETVINTITCGDFTYWRHESSVINIVHELGHVFDPKIPGVPNSGSYGLPLIFVIHKNTILHDNSTIQWQPNTKADQNEVFGNFFVAWIYGVWGPDADKPYAGVGTPRDWMTTNMSEWTP